MSTTYGVAERVIEKLGGFAAVSAYLAVAQVTVYRWTYPPPKGTDGLIPVRHHDSLLEMAKLTNVRLTRADLYPTE